MGRSLHLGHGWLRHRPDPRIDPGGLGRFGRRRGHLLRYRRDLRARRERTDHRWRCWPPTRSGPRSAVVATKFMPSPWKVNVRGALLKSLRASLDRLGLPAVDLYQIHGPISLRSHAAMAAALAAAHRAGPGQGGRRLQLLGGGDPFHGGGARWARHETGDQPDRVLLVATVTGAERPDRCVHTNWGWCRWPSPRSVRVVSPASTRRPIRLPESEPSPITRWKWSTGWSPSSAASVRSTVGRRRARWPSTG